MANTSVLLSKINFCMDEYLFERDLTLAEEKFMQSGGPGFGLMSPASSRSVRRLRGGSFDGIWTFFLNKKCRQEAVGVRGG